MSRKKRRLVEPRYTDAEWEQIMAREDAEPLEQAATQGCVCVLVLAAIDDAGEIYTHRVTPGESRIDAIRALVLNNPKMRDIADTFWLRGELELPRRTLALAEAPCPA